MPSDPLSAPGLTRPCDSAWEAGELPRCRAYARLGRWPGCPPPRPGYRPPAPAVVPVARASPSGTPVTVWRRSGSFFVAMGAKLLHGKISFRDDRLTGLGGAGRMSFLVPGKSSEPSGAADARPCRNIVAVQMMPGHQDHHRDESHATAAMTGSIFSTMFYHPLGAGVRAPDRRPRRRYPQEK